MAQWYYQAGETQRGPLRLDELQFLIRRGKLSPEVLVRRGATGQWVPAWQVPELARAAAPPAYTRAEKPARIDPRTRSRLPTAVKTLELPSQPSPEPEPDPVAELSVPEPIPRPEAAPSLLWTCSACSVIGLVLAALGSLLLLAVGREVFLGSVLPWLVGLSAAVALAATVAAVAAPSPGLRRWLLGSIPAGTVFSLVLLLVALAAPQAADQDVALQDTREGLRDVKQLLAAAQTVLLRLPDGQDPNVGSSGVLRRAGNELILITNRHVAFSYVPYRELLELEQAIQEGRGESYLRNLRKQFPNEDLFIQYWSDLLSARALMLGGYFLVEFSSGKRKRVTHFCVASGKVDLAKIKVDATGLEPGVDYYPLPYNSDLKYDVGDKVFAVGTPKNKLFKSTITEGIVSGFRDMNNTHCIQTTAAINSGNSGGPLFVQKGEGAEKRFFWVGVNTWSRRESEALHFAIDACVVMNIEFHPWHRADPQGYLEAWQAGE